MCGVRGVCVRVVCDVCDSLGTRPLLAGSGSETMCVRVCGVCHTMTRSLPEIQFHKKFPIVAGDWLHRGPNKTTVGGGHLQRSGCLLRTTRYNSTLF